MSRYYFSKINWNKANRESMISIFGEDILTLYPEYREEFDKEKNKRKKNNKSQLN